MLYAIAMLFYLYRKKIEREVSRRVTEACEKILQEEGANMHDASARRILACTYVIDTLKRSALDPELQVIVTKLEIYFEDLVQVVRAESHSQLPPRAKDDTLDNLLKTLCCDMEVISRCHIHLTSEGQPSPLSKDVEMHIFRIVQELIQNAARHSGAWHIWIRMLWQPGTLTIEVEDDGSGFNRVKEFIDRLRKKDNSLKMRSRTIGASIDYKWGTKGLLAIFRMKTT